mmetsp:Transcript_32189/g.51225  ORF Transcript_32189/g.51225 Transcript_32189/m.51225 type:complete len:1442 (+) Transcript_32189:1312-5637(+)|eukprot:CAMPEP_0203744758 /NCGR_PEP_ID=MMETSP0098-20131031/727_1 /ASSEMBLY_ACC=CAM_ASM_000208 /TAXON_ID=96639 /ORGANISM=" , Strain NY0313808BC1" /LENGTH=1441 /DNA_ID=CAMNT_0050632367 /DNA_START=529 /DNA_END=4854 /DNA_ORIENTATION=-
MTHLSDFSYMQRLVVNTFVIPFIFWYVFVLFKGAAYLSMEKVRKFNFKSLVIVLLVTGMIFTYISDCVSATIKYREGYLDLCKGECFPASSGAMNCSYRVGCTDEVITRPADEYIYEDDKGVLREVANTFWNIGCTLRSSAFFLLIATFNLALKVIVHKSVFSHSEIYACVVYSVLSVPINFILQFGARSNSLLTVVLPQMLYSLEVLVQTVLLGVTNIRINRILSNMDRNYTQPQGSEAVLLYIRCLSLVLMVFLCMDAVGALAINIDVLVDYTKDNDGAIAYEGKLKVDIFTALFNFGFLMAPIVSTFLMFRPVSGRNANITIPHTLQSTATSRTRLDINSDFACPENEVGTGTPPNEERPSSQSPFQEDATEQTVAKSCQGESVQVVEVTQKEETSRVEPTKQVHEKNNREEEYRVPVNSDIEENEQKETPGLRHRAQTVLVTKQLEPTHGAYMLNALNHNQQKQSRLSSLEFKPISEVLGRNSSGTERDENTDIESGTNTNEDNEHIESEYQAFVVGAAGEPTSAETDPNGANASGDNDGPTSVPATSFIQNPPSPHRPPRQLARYTTTFGRLKKSTPFWQKSKGTKEQALNSSSTHSSSSFQSFRKMFRFSGKAVPPETERPRRLSYLEDLRLPGEKRRRMKLARLWVRDALENRSPKLHRVRGLPLEAYHFIFSPIWRWTLYVFLLVQIVVLPFLEPASTLRIPLAELETEAPHYQVALWLDLFIVMLFFVDAFLIIFAYGVKELQLFCFTWESLIEKRHRRSLVFHARMLFSFVSFVNIIVALVNPTSFRVDRLFRWLMVVFMNKGVRNVFGDLVATSRNFMGVVATYVFFIVIYALIGIVVFNPDAYSEFRDKFWGTEIDAPSNIYRIDSSFWIALNLYVLTTLEGFPDVLWPAYAYTPVLSFIYFTSFVMLTIILLQSIAVPLVYLPLQNRQRKRLLENKITACKGLVAAFEVLDANEKYCLESKLVIKLLCAFTSKENARVMIGLMDSDRNGTIDLLEFFQIVDMIKLKIRIKDNTEHRPYLNIFRYTFERKKFRKFRKNAWFRRLSVAMTTILIGVLLLYRLVPLSVLVFTAGVYLLFVGFELALAGISRRKSYRSRQIMNVLIFLWFVEVLLFFVYLGTSKLVVFNILQVVLVHHIYRVVYVLPTLKLIIYVTSKLRNVLGIISLVVFCLVYGYTMFGMEVFSRNKYTSHPAGKTDFGSFSHAFISVFQLVTGEQWNVLLYMNFVSGDNLGYALLSSGYFLSFNLIVNVYILSIVLAIFLDAFLLFKDVKEDTVSEFSEDTKAAKVLGLQPKKYLLFKKRSLEETLYEDFLERNSKNTIQELLDLGIIRNVGVMKKFTVVEKKGDKERPVFQLDSQADETNEDSNEHIARSGSARRGLPKTVLRTSSQESKPRSRASLPSLNLSQRNFSVELGTLNSNSRTGMGDISEY